jgi:N-succinyl-L-ornithine transcarbamylase
MSSLADYIQPENGQGKTLGLIFLNPSLRTRMSTQKAAYNLGMDVISLNLNQDSWKIEFDHGKIMDGDSQEHIKDAVKVMSGYCDIIGVRTFASLENKEKDYNEEVLNAFLEYSNVPVISLESATRHPLQSLADLVTIRELGLKKPKVVVSWAPHPKSLPQAVPNSFLEWIVHTESDVILTHPEGYELADEFTKGIEVTHNQEEAFMDADVIYVKSWSSYESYGQRVGDHKEWIINEQKMALTNRAHFMHCLPIRRNVIATDRVIDDSMIYEQAKNREYAAQAVLNRLL